MIDTRGRTPVAAGLPIQVRLAFSWRPGANEKCAQYVERKAGSVDEVIEAAGLAARLGEETA
jgi:hypothetical protein